MNRLPSLYKNLVGTLNLSIIGSIVLLAMVSTSANAAYCSLRDPVIAINNLFPESDNHRSIVRPVTQHERQRISEELPFTLHFNEIGQHTLYVSQQGKNAIGFVHARSELSSQGIIEIAWAMNQDMTINGFFFQRCRNSACTGEFSQQLSRDLQGKTFNDLLLLLDDTSSQLTPAMQLQYGTKSDLVLAIVRSGLKTLSLTQIAWANDIAKIRRQSMAQQHLGTNGTIKIKAIVNKTLSKQDNTSIIKSDTVKTFAVLNNGQVLGHLVEASWQQSELEGNFNWLFSPQGKVLAIETSSKWPNREVETAFDEIVGTDFSDLKTCTTTVESAGKDLFDSLPKSP